MQLASAIFGTATERPALLVVHGLFGSQRNWSSIAKRLALLREVVTVDLRNHGQSPRSPVHDYPAMAADLAETIAGHGGPMDVLGHSMGGKAAMTLALTRPELVRRLVVADIAPVAYDHDQMRYVDAMRGVDLARITRRGEADAALAGAVPEAAVRAFLLQSLVVEDGRAEWRINLDTLAAEMPKILDFPATDARFDGATLFLTGAASAYVKPAYRARVLALFPAAEHHALAGAGHWLHADAPNAFVAAVERFLDRD
ncbi:MAG: alpha/beta fold hydrolase [Amaricoccus sp.]|uniref:alpha/beta fold hydrolase n=1 Tax=Amaricoccus sp. TaxID=1872485 RepID=UPI0039E63156